MNNHNKYTSLEVPKDGKDSIEIGDLDFEFIEELCFAQMYFTLNITISAKTTQIEQGIQEQFLQDDFDLGKIELQLRLGNLCKNGVHSTTVDVDTGDKYKPRNIGFTTDGINEDLHFYGIVSFVSGWLLVKGEFRKLDQKRSNLTVNITKKFSTELLPWTQYSYTLDETQGMDPRLVTSIYMDAFNGTCFPEQALQFKELTHLRLSNSPGNEQAITELPESIGDLHQLIELTIDNTGIKHLPDKLLKLPELEALSITNSQLQEIPGDIDLPVLRRADFRGNQLTTLPEKLALQPNLYRLNLDQNPWQSLPEAFNGVPSLGLNASDLRRLLNYQSQTGGNESLRATQTFPNKMKLVDTGVADANKNTLMLLKEDGSPLTKTKVCGAVYINETKFAVYSGGHQISDDKKTGLYVIGAGFDWNASTPNELRGIATGKFRRAVESQISLLEGTCVCAFPRIIDYLHNKRQTKESDLLAIAIRKTLQRVRRDANIEEFVCTTCKSVYKWKYEERRIDDTRLTKRNVKNTVGKEPLDPAPNFLLIYTSELYDRKYPWIKKLKLEKATLEEMVDYLFEAR